MNACFEFTLPVYENLIKRLGLVLVHSLWQFTLVAFVTAVLMRLMRRRPANTQSPALIYLFETLIVLPAETWILNQSDQLSRIGVSARASFCLVARLAAIALLMGLMSLPGNSEVTAMDEIEKDQTEPDEDGVYWSDRSKDGWVAGMRIVEQASSENPSLVVQHLLRNDSDQERTVNLSIQGGDGTWLDLSSDNRVEVHFSGSNTEDVTAKPGQVLEPENWQAKINVQSLAPAEYLMRFGPVFYVKVEGQIGVRTSIPFELKLPVNVRTSPNENVSESPQVVKETNSPYAKLPISWGKPVSGLRIGVVLERSPKTGDNNFEHGDLVRAELFVQNVSDRKVACQVMLPHPMDGWGLNIENSEKTLSRNQLMIMIISPMRLIHADLLPNEIQRITGVLPKFREGGEDDGSPLELKHAEFKIGETQSKDAEHAPPFTYGMPEGSYSIRCFAILRRSGSADVNLSVGTGSVKLHVGASNPENEEKQVQPVKNDELNGENRKTSRVELRFVGKTDKEPLSDLQVIAENPKTEKHFGPFTTNEEGLIDVKLPFGFYQLELASADETPFLAVEELWEKQGRTWPPDLSLSVKKSGAEKWLDGKQRDVGFEPPATANDAPRITYTLLPATELVLRAVDAKTGKGIPGAEFYTENAIGEDWAHAITGQNLGWKKSDDAEAGLTDKEGNFKRLISANAGFMYLVWKSPPGYEPVDSSDVEVDLVYGQARAEHIFKFNRVAAKESPAAKNEATRNVVDEKKGNDAEQIEEKRIDQSDAGR